MNYDDYDDQVFDVGYAVLKTDIVNVQDVIEDIETNIYNINICLENMVSDIKTVESNNCFEEYKSKMFPRDTYDIDEALTEIDNFVESVNNLKRKLTHLKYDVDDYNNY